MAGPGPRPHLEDLPTSSTLDQPDAEAKANTASLAVAALRNAVGLRGTCASTIVHSDRGGQFRSVKFSRALVTAGLKGSMGRAGTCADNAAMESFFALLQKNVLDQKAGKPERSCALRS